MKMGEAIYKSEQAEAGEAAEGDAAMGGERDAANDETIVDADFEEVDDDDEPKGQSSTS